MARPRIVEMEYFRFQQVLRNAIDSGKRIDSADKVRWKDWVRENKIKEAAFKSFGKGMFEGLQPVIIDTDDEWRGYYLVSTDEEACIKWSQDDS